MSTKELPLIEFTARDRCDRCMAQAYTMARSDLGELLFCAHHSRQHREQLMDEGWELVDDVAALEEIGYTLPELV